MSYVADIVMVTSIMDDTNIYIDEFNKWMREEYGDHTCLVNVTKHAGGGKVMGIQVWICAVNYLHEEEFINRFKKIKFEAPEDVQLFLKQEEEDILRQITL